MAPRTPSGTAHGDSGSRLPPEPTTEARICREEGGGHVERGESPHAAVRRECLEELGIRIHDPRPIPMEVSDPTLDVHAFLVTRWDGEPVNVAPEEHDDLRWFEPRDLPALEMAHPSSVPNILSAIRGAD
ncbi:NUDIX domain-containing protein [Nocardioides pinisoli]|uniref:NUDIX domain-containing protein n=1 Tax=Nocardioides pinisoli TaxID=2950279 RepID=A0ABT1KZK1_9ACTN|nr:NUDIX domain-containing protein [Nocardioides pinisoli]MCP3422453.1 NUDIX domain-containing protein [Nocardioides pinisoli]